MPMEPQETKWQEFTDSPADQARCRSRAGARGDRRLRTMLLLAGVFLCVGGLVLMLLAGGLRQRGLFIPAVLLLGAGATLVLTRFETVYRVTNRGRGRIEVERVTQLADPERELLDVEMQRRADQGFQAFMGESDDGQPPPAVKVRCLRCQALNEEQTNFCNGCGASLR
jgi:hypothetical protein